MECLDRSYGLYHTELRQKAAIHLHIFKDYSEDWRMMKMLRQEKHCFTFAKAKKTNICVNFKLKSFKDIQISENLA